MTIIVMPGLKALCCEAAPFIIAVALAVLMLISLMPLMPDIPEIVSAVPVAVAVDICPDMLISAAAVAICEVMTLNKSMQDTLCKRGTYTANRFS